MGVSVCMATFNGGKYILPQLESILSQLQEQDELVISDDSSSDDTVEIIRSLNDPRINLYENQKFGSPIFNFEQAISRAKNEIIILSDQDDIWLPGRVDAAKKYLQDYDVVVCNARVVDRYLNIINESFFQVRGSGSGIIRNLLTNTYLGCCMAFHRKLLKLALPFPKDIPMHDIWLGFVAEFFLKPVFIEEKLILYRRHEDNKTTTSQASGNNFYHKFLFRINLLKYLPVLLKRKIRGGGK
jgi:glycosyltransferase involved in cell wall biosynthesis